MIRDYERDIRLAAFNPASQGYNTPKSHTAQIRRFSPTRRRRVTPTFLDIIEQICENVALSLNSDHK